MTTADIADPIEWKPGRKQYMTDQQERILAHLEEHGWSKLYELSKALDLHSYVVMGSLQCLENKDLVDVCLVARVKHWALKGKKLPPGGMAFDRGAPSMYHTNLKGRIETLLEAEPWLSRSMIQKRLKNIGTPKAIEGAIHELTLAGRTQRHLVESPIRQLYAYALPAAPPPTAKQLLKVRDEIGHATNYWPTYEKIEKALKKEPWQSAKQVAAATGMKVGGINNKLKSMMDRGMVQRVKVILEHRGRNRHPDYLYALPGEVPPKRIPVIDGEAAPQSAKIRIMRILEDLGPSTPAAIVAENTKRKGRPIEIKHVRRLLDECEDLGIVEHDRFGCKAGRYRVVKDLDPLVRKEAEAHRKAMERSASRLRALGYSVEILVAPPRKAAVDGGGP